jgi:hypothetical protein
MVLFKESSGKLNGKTISRNTNKDFEKEEGKQFVNRAK